jgi:hypothetical protein
MKEIILSTATITGEAENPASDKYKTRSTGWMPALFLSTAAGIVSLLAGLGLGAVSYLGAVRNPDALNQLGNFLICLAFPLMMLAAHALDRINEIRRDKK